MGRVRVGTAGWSYKDWEGVVYPAKLPSAERIEYLVQFFDLIEINTSFYGHIRPAVGKQWCQAAAGNRDFLFTAKLNRAFTHSRGHSPAASLESTAAETIHPKPSDESDAKAGLDSIAAEGKLGAVLAQFPMSFKRDERNRAYVEQLVGKFREYPLVLEVRHASWNDPAMLTWLSDLGVGLCNIDQPLIGRALAPASQATSAIGYVRLHGRNYKQWFAETTVRDRYNYLYSAKELEAWRQRTLETAAKTEKTFVVTNNHNLGKAAVNALELISMIEKRAVKTPPLLTEHYPELRDISE